MTSIFYAYLAHLFKNEPKVLLTAVLTAALSSPAFAVDVDTVDTNATLNTFQRLEVNSLSITKKVNGIVDAFNDEEGLSQIEDGVNFIVSDLSGLGHDITLHGDARVSTSVQYSQDFGASLSFDGNGDYLSSPDSSDWNVFASELDDWTIDCWLKLNSHSTNERIFTTDNTSESFFELLHRAGTGYGFYLHACNSGNYYLGICYAGEIMDSDWHHIAVVKKGNEVGLYKDGEQVAYTSYRGTTPLWGRRSPDRKKRRRRT